MREHAPADICLSSPSRRLYRYPLLYPVIVKWTLDLEAVVLRGTPSVANMALRAGLANESGVSVRAQLLQDSPNPQP